MFWRVLCVVSDRKRRMGNVFFFKIYFRKFSPTSEVTESVSVIGITFHFIIAQYDYDVEPLCIEII